MIALRDAAVTLGGRRQETVEIVFADAAVFQQFGLANEPAIILGMDVLSRLSRFAVDYPRREFQFAD